jgi:hypothetical protein
MLAASHGSPATPPRVRIVAIGMIATALAAIASPAAATPPRKNAVSMRTDGCTSLTARTSYGYIVTGRARPLIVWTGRRDVGVARITRTTGAPGHQRIDLLIGTDPERAPMRVNRWGYASESTCGDHTRVVGLMTESDEDTIQAATVSVGAAADGTYQYRAVRGVVMPGSAETELLRISTDRSFTHRDVDEMLDLLPSPGAMQPTMVPAGVAPGFLLVMAEVLATGRHVASRRTYVYSGVLYELKGSAPTERESAVVGARTYEHVIETEFEARNSTSGEVTHFQVTSGTAATGAALAGVPVRVVYRPRWWLELELLLDAVRR